MPRRIRVEYGLMGVRASFSPAAILFSLGFATCFTDTVHFEEKSRPYEMNLTLHTPILEPLPLFFADFFGGMHSPDTQTCLAARNESPEFLPGVRSPRPSISWPEYETGGWSLRYWQVQKFRAFDGTLQVFGNLNRMRKVSIALDDQPPTIEVELDGMIPLNINSAASEPVHVVATRIVPQPNGEFDFLLEFGLRIDTSRLIEGAHRLSITVDSPDIVSVKRRIREGDQTRTEETPASSFAYWACFEVLLNATAIKKAPDGALWVGTFEGGLMKVDLGKSRDRADDDAVSFFQGDTMDSGMLSLPEATGDLSGNSITRLAFDLQGNLWVGTLFHDFTVMKEGAFATKFDTPDVGEFDFGISTFANPAELTRYMMQELSDTITGFAFISDKEVMIATLNGLYYLNHKGTLQNRSDDRWVRFDQKDGLADANLIGVEVDKDGFVWAATTDLSDEDRPEEQDGEGIFVLDMKGTPENKSDDRWVNFTPEEGKFDERVLMFEQDADGGKWIGAIGGLFYLDDGGTPFDKLDDKWAKFGIADGFIDEDISSIYFHGPSKYLVGAVDILTPEPNTPPGGALIAVQLEGRPHEKKIKSLVNYTINDGFVDADVSSIEIDKFGRVAFSSFNFFHSPLVLSLYSTVELKSGSPAQGLFGSSGGTGGGGGFTISLGRDGVSFIDLGANEENKADDQIVNLVPKRIRIKGKRL